MTAWRDQAACLDYYAAHDVRTEGDPWFPDERGEERERLARIAKSVCATCPVLAQCEANRKRRDVGVWGGVEYELGTSLKNAVIRDGKPIRHGTDAGYHQHRSRGVVMCLDCIDAHREYRRIDQRARRAAGVA